MPESFQHKLEKFDVGMIWLDKDKRVMALNSYAAQVLDVKPGEVIGNEILQFHPERSRSKVAWVLESSECPVDSPPPMTMMINIPDRVLLIKVSKMFGADGGAGTCMVFFDLTDVTTTPHLSDEAQDRPRTLFKLPIYKNGRVVLVDLSDVVHMKAEGHYTEVYTESDHYLCNLSLSDLEERLDPLQFVRVHRSHMVNMRYASAFEKAEDRCVMVMAGAGEPRIPISRSNVSKIKALLGLV